MQRQTLKSSPQRIALLDDDPDFGALMAQFVSDTGRFRPLDFHITGEHLMGSLPQKAPEIALIDIKLPGRSGLEWAREIKQRRPYVKIIFVTAFPDEETIEAALHLAGSSYLIKPFSRDDLNQALRTVASGGVYLSAGVRDFLSSLPPAESVPADGKPNQPPACTDSRASQMRPAIPITPRQASVLRLAAQGKSYKQIADMLGVHIKTIDNELALVRTKTGTHTTMEALLNLMWIKGKDDSDK